VTICYEQRTVVIDVAVFSRLVMEVDTFMHIPGCQQFLSTSLV